MNQQFPSLLEKYLDEKITAQETAEFFLLMQQEENQEHLQNQIGEDFLQDKYLLAEDTIRAERIKKNLLSRIQVEPVETVEKARVVSMPFRRIAAAAVILILLSFGGYIYFNRNNATTPGNTTAQLQPSTDVVAPAGSKATITLADGRKVSLDSLSSGTLANQGNVTITKTAAGQIIYGGSNSPLGLGANTLTNPRGSTVIDMTLADGSRVWLNAGSSLTYPVAFTGKERNVSITGEAFFEVAHNASLPFKVSKGEMEVQVLGTQFNVNTYEDEANIKVTLIEGSVRVSLPSVKTSVASVVKLIPGQQAVVTTKTSQLTIHHSPDLEEVMAWKNGLFKFNKTNIQTIMHQVARWYDVEITYKGNFADLDFGGTISRKANVSELLKLLEATEAVHFIIQGKKIIVTH